MANPASSPIFYEAPNYSSAGQYAVAVALADVNGDGRLDAVVVNDCSGNSSNCSNGSVSVLLGNGDGSFQAAISYESGGIDSIAVAIADLNGDAKPDIVVANVQASSSNNGYGSVSVLLGNGDGTFQSAVNYNSTGQVTYSVAAADLNGDGKPDLILANEYASSNSSSYGGVSVLLGNGDGTFQAATNYNSGGLYTTSVSVADLNGDGKPDLISVNACADSHCVNGSASVLLGNGDGTFQTPVNYNSTGNGTYWITVADLNGDGRPDLVLANQSAGYGNYSCGSVSVLLGNGDGTLQPAVGYNSGGFNTYSVAVADMNGDGNPDIIDSNLDESSVSVLLGNGNGSFKPAVSFNSGGPYGRSVTIADLNGDGRPDVVLANQCDNYTCLSGSAAVLLGNGDGTLQAEPAFSLNAGDAFESALRDMNGDGKLDLIVVNQCAATNCSSGSAAVLLGDGEGNFQPAINYAVPGQYPNSIAVADLNGDGKPDLVVGSEVSGSSAYGLASVLLGNGDGSFQSAMSYTSGGIDTYSIALADLNGDGKPDVILGNDCATFDCSTGSVSVLLGNGDGSLQPVTSYNSGGQYTFSLAVADFNGDGTPDIALANENGTSGCSGCNGSVSILLGNGDGTFQAAVNYDSGGASSLSIAVADLNGDGKFDLIVSNDCVNGCSNGGGVSVLLGNGDGTFQAALSTSTSNLNFGQLAVADFNGDGNLDVAAGMGNVLLLGNGDGTFQSPLTLGAYGFGVAAGDVNGDGKLDLAIVNSSAATVLRNISSRVMATATTLVSAANPAVYNQAVTFTATVSSSGTGTPSGSVTFYDGTTSIGTGTLTGKTATFSTSTLTLGSHSITATYSGDSNFSGSTSSVLAQMVNQAPTSTTVTSSANPVTVGQPVTFTATVLGQYGGTPSGTVTFVSGTNTLGTSSLTSGIATITFTFQAGGTHSITAMYSGDSNFTTSTSPALNQGVNKVTSTTSISSSLDPSVYGQAIIFTATVASSLGPPPDGETVIFGTGTVILATSTTKGGVATFTTSTLNVGTRNIKAHYSGDIKRNGSTSAPLAQVTSKARTMSAIISSQNPSTAGQAVTFTVTVTGQYGGAPTGTVTFTDNTVSLGTATLSGDTASLTTSSLSTGKHTIKAAYGGDANFRNSATSLIQTVN